MILESPPAAHIPPSDIEEALLNEAYLGLLIALAARHYANTAPSGMPFALAFVAIPLVVHEPTRALLPGRTNARFGKWVEANPFIRSRTAEHAVALTPFVQRAIRYSLRSGALTLDGETLKSSIPLRRHAALATADARDAGKQAAFVGRWFAAVGDVPAIFRLIGLSP
jgi:hypothetical protein